MKLGEIYTNPVGRSSQIVEEDLAEFKTGLVIIEAEVVGKDRQGIRLHFKGTNLTHKCNRHDAYLIADKYKIDDTKEFVEKRVNFEVKKKHVRIKV